MQPRAGEWEEPVAGNAYPHVAQVSVGGVDRGRGNPGLRDELSKLVGQEDPLRTPLLGVAKLGRGRFGTEHPAHCEQQHRLGQPLEDPRLTETRSQKILDTNVQRGSTKTVSGTCPGRR